MEDLYTHYLTDLDDLKSGKVTPSQSDIFSLLQSNPSQQDLQAILTQQFSKAHTSDMALTNLTLLHLVAMNAKDWALDVILVIKELLLKAEFLPLN